jgi:hypothetical protein
VYTFQGRGCYFLWLFLRRSLYVLTDELGGSRLVGSTNCTPFIDLQNLKNDWLIFLRKYNHCEDMMNFLRSAYFAKQRFKISTSSNTYREEATRAIDGNSSMGDNHSRQFYLSEASLAVDTRESNASNTYGDKAI